MTMYDFASWIRTIPSRDFGLLLTLIAAERQRRDICEHGVAAGDWCEACNRAYHLAASVRKGEET